MDPAHKYTHRNRKILEDALQGATFLHIANTNNLTPERIRQIVGKYSGFTGRDLQTARKEYDKALHQNYKNLLDVLQQHYFDKLIEENGLDHALAWRCKEVYGWGKKYSLETLEKLIAARRAGEGYYRCVKLAGIAETLKETRIRTPHAAGILKMALCDVVLDIHHKNFAEGKSLSYEEEERLKKMWNAGVSPTEIQETLGLVSPASYYARKFGLGKRKATTASEILVDHSYLDRLISEGNTYSEMKSLGFSEYTIRRRKKALGVTRLTS
ncbi:MAG: hypothetical protein Q8R18_03965 [bacterium]|nr:hypothetical protein [bacterium]